MTAYFCKSIAPRNNTRLLRFRCVRCTNTKGECMNTHQNWSASASFCHNLENKINTQSLILFIHSIKLCSVYMWWIRHFKSKKNLLNITYKIQLPWKANESNFCTPECILLYSHVQVRCSECNYTKIKQAPC